MAKFDRVAGSTSQSVSIFIQDSSSTVGAGLSGLVFNTSGLACYYTFTGANTTAVVISLVTLATVTTAFAEGGFIEIDATHQKGLYRLDLKNSSLAASKGNLVTFFLYGAANMAPCVFDVQLTGVDNQDGVRYGMTALPNAAANAAGGLPVSIAGALDLDEMNVDIEAIQTSTAGLTYTVSNKVDANVYTWNGTAVSSPATAGIPEVNVKNINNVSTSSVTTVKAVQGLTTADTIATYTGNTVQTGDSYATLTGTNTEVTAVPASTATLVSMIKWLYILSRNKLTQTSTTQIVKANDNSTTVGTSTVSDDGTTAVRGIFS